MNLTNIQIDETGIVCYHNGDKLFLELPDMPNSQHFINHEPLKDVTYIKQLQAQLDEYFGNGDKVLARLCYAGGKTYHSYEESNGIFTTDNGDTFIEGSASDYYNVLYFQPFDNIDELDEKSM
ncbi:hypothetical protein ACFBZI_12065 [Moraxella sp. ZJ142]|uniref:hypothetical protein n=1 Tax=Moraxella marmotae TaxID=3344520 RepID=UPI0035D4F5D7